MSVDTLPREIIYKMRNDLILSTCSYKRIRLSGLGMSGHRERNLASFPKEMIVRIGGLEGPSTYEHQKQLMMIWIFSYLKITEARPYHESKTYYT